MFGTSLDISPSVFGLVLTFCIIYLTYRYFSKDTGWWASQGVPTFHTSILHYFYLYTKKLYFLDLEVKTYKKLGRVYGRYDGTLPVLTVGDPDMLKDILVKDFHIFHNRRDVRFGDPIMDNNVSVLCGSDWKRVRNVMSPAFTSGKLRRMIPKLKESCSILIDSMKASSRDGISIDVNRFVGAYILDVIASCAFGTKLNSLKDPDNAFVVHAKGFFSDGCSSLRSILPVLCPSLMKLFKISMLNPSSNKFFRDLTLQIVEERKKLNEVGTDYLQQLIDAGKHNECADDEISKQKSKLLSEDELAAQCVVFFLAGYDTTTSMLQVILYNVAKDESIQEKLVKELFDTLQDKEELAYEDFMGMKYLDQVVSEALRLGTGCIRMERRVEEDYKLQNIQLKEGQLISLPIHAIHHDSEWYPNPYVFDPERFTAAAKESRHPFVYLPFGIGPRNCVASRFALMEVKFTITKILQQFKLKLSPETPIPLGFKVKQGSLISNNLYLTVEER